MYKRQALFFADRTVNVHMDAAKMAQIAVLTARLARQFDIEPRVAMLSYSNFGSVNNPHSQMVRAATELVKQREPDLLIDGEITSIEPMLRYRGTNTIVIRGYDKTHRLHRGKKTAVFQQVSDSDLFSRIASAAGLTAAAATAAG